MLYLELNTSLSTLRCPMLYTQHKKNVELAVSYWSISLLPIMSKVLERSAFHKKVFLRTNMASREIILRSNKVGNRNKITEATEQKQYSTDTFLDIEKAFDKVWHGGLLYKIKVNLLIAFYHVIKSYLKTRTLLVKIQGSISDIHKIRPGVPQGSVLGSFCIPPCTSR